MKTPPVKTASQKLDEILSYIERCYLEPYKLVNSDQLTEALNAKIELAGTIKHLINSI